METEHLGFALLALIVLYRYSTGEYPIKIEVDE